MKTSSDSYSTLLLKAIRLSSSSAQLQGHFILTVRKFLGMSIKELASRLGLSTATIQQMEKREASGAITIESMRKLAEAMNCEFQYSFVPKIDLNEFILEEAKKKASSLLKKTQIHMELEDQKSPDHIVSREELLALELIKKGKVWS